MVVVAYPLRCGDKDPVPPASIEIVPSQGAPPRRDGELVTGDAIARLLPGLPLPASSIAATFTMDRPRAGDSIKIAYPESACGAPNEVVLAMKYSNARAVNTPAPSLPAGMPPTDRPVRLQALIDVDGMAQRISYIGGPQALTAAAADAVRRWTTEPARLNGSGIVTPVTLQVKFVTP